MLDRQLRTLAILFSFASLSKHFVAYLGMNDSMPTIPQPWMEIWLTVRIMLIPWGYGSAFPCEPLAWER